MLQTAAPSEGITPDIPDPFGKRDVCKAGTVFEDGSPDENTGNFGTVDTNEGGGTVTTNAGTVMINMKDGTIETNGGIVTTNSEGALISENSGEVKTNEGEITKNTGKVGTNKGMIDNYEGGTVETNEGEGEVYNYGGTVSSNQGTEYFSVSITVNNGSVSYDNGITDHNESKWFGNSNGGAAATVTITPNQGFKIDKISLPEGVDAAKNKDGSWTITVNSLTDAFILSMDSKPIPKPKPQPRDSRGSEETEEEISINVSLVSDFERFNLALAERIRRAPANGTVTADAGTFTGLTGVVFAALAERPDVTAEIRYADQGGSHLLTIPAGFDVTGLLKGSWFVSFADLAAMLK